MKKHILFSLTLLSLGLAAYAQDFNLNNDAPLDPPYRDLVNPKIVKRKSNSNKGLNGKNDIDMVISFQTEVKSQGSRGTCSIFSAVALLEAMLVKSGEVDNTLDLSEEWVEYLAMKDRTEDGYWAYRSWNNISVSGIALEEDWNYLGETWEDLDYSDLSKERCEKVTSTKQKSCLLAHRNPNLLMASSQELKNESSDLFDLEFLNIRSSARNFKREHLNGKLMAASAYSSNYQVYNTNDIKNLLDQSVPMVMSVEFYYGAWNHRKADSLGIGRDSQAWSDGVVGYPEPNSVDAFESRKSANRAGHSIVVVGYDDNKIVKTKVKMRDGTVKEFTYKGVYYFKNSWGTSGFGVDMMIEGSQRPGYGMMTQKYAHEHGSFYRLQVKN